MITGIENPLLDIQLDLPNEDLLTEFQLKPGHACLAEPSHMPLFEKLWHAEGKITIPGGSSLNTVRAANHMLKSEHPNKCAYFGSIGNDEVGKTLQRELEQNGVKGMFHIDEETPTGSCAVLIHNNDRTLCANLAACLKYKTEHLRQNIDVVAKSQLLYTSAFFITSNFEALQEYARFAVEHNKPLGFNLSACFLIQFNTE